MLSTLDYSIIGSFLLITLIIGLYAAHKNKKTAADYFAAGRNMPWWLLGFSMVATTFSADTPNLVTNIVRQHGIFGNWQWWAFLPSGMLTVFLYAKLWRRSEAITDLEFYKLRYSGKLAQFLRGFRALYLGVVFNVLIMASVSLAAIKIGAVMFELTPIQSVLGAMIITTTFSALGGLRGVLLSDFMLFIVSMTGSIAACYFVLNMPEVGGVSGLLDKLSQTPELKQKTLTFGYSNWADLVSLFIIPFAVVWWSVWYPGSEPGGGGFLVQRMLAAKDEKNAVLATFFFNIAHYALRPWPWILVALASLVVFPDIQSLHSAVAGNLPESQIANDVAYSLMLTKIPSGWMGIVVASLLGAYISTISTHLNWGASYLVNDFWAASINPNISEKKKVLYGRIFTVLLMILSAILALNLQSALATFNIALSIGAGTGLLFMLRWFWSKINALAELVAMIASFIFAIYFNACHNICFPNLSLTTSEAMVVAVFLTTICWVTAALCGPKTDAKVLNSFYKKIKPTVSYNAIIAAILSCIMIYSLLIATGNFIYNNVTNGCYSLAISIVCAAIVIKINPLQTRK